MTPSEPHRKEFFAALSALATVAPEVPPCGLDGTEVANVLHIAARLLALSSDPLDAMFGA